MLTWLAMAVCLGAVGFFFAGCPCCGAVCGACTRRRLWLNHIGWLIYALRYRVVLAVHRRLCKHCRKRG